MTEPFSSDRIKSINRILDSRIQFNSIQSYSINRRQLRILSECCQSSSTPYHNRGRIWIFEGQITLIFTVAVMNIIPVPTLILLQLVPFLLTVSVLYFVLFKPMLAYLDERDEKISGAKEQAVSMQNYV